MKNQLKTAFLLGSLTALVMGVGALVAPGQLYLFAALALAMNLGAYFFSDRIVLRMHRAREVTPAEAPDLYSLVAELAARARIPVPRVYVVPELQPNAFATGRDPAHGVIAVTEGLLSTLDRRELRGVIAHELAHIANRDVLVASIAAAAATVVTYVAQLLTFGSLFGGGSQDEEEGGAGGILVALVAPIAATLIQMGISRSREYLADETGARTTGDPEALAHALLKLDRAVAVVPARTRSPSTSGLFIVNPLGAVRSVAGLFSTHPSTAERVARLAELSHGGRTGTARARRSVLLDGG